MLTLADLKASSIVNVAGKCANSPEFTQLINEATRRLMRRGDWVGTVVPIQICVNSGCVVLPRYVQSVRKLNTCHHRLPVHNLWYSFLDSNSWDHGRWGGYGGEGWWRGAYHAAGSLVARGQTCCFNDIPSDGWFVRAYASCREDWGNTVTIFGMDTNNQVLRTNNGDGTWSEGVTLTLGSSGQNPNYASTSMYVRRIDRVVKDATQCQVRLFAYAPTLDLGVAPNLGLLDLAIYDPGELTPTYTRYQLCIPQPVLGMSGACCGAVHSVVALCKLRFIPAQYPSDLVLIDNLDALKSEVQSVRAQEAGDLQLAKGYEADAVHELNRELEDNSPDDTFSAQNNVFGGLSFSNRSF